MIWLVWTLFIMVDALFNHWLIANKKKVFHGLNSLYRLVMVLSMVLVFGMNDYKTIAMFSLGAFFSEWLIFNFLLNWLNGWKWDYLGSTALLDRLESSAPTFVLWIKIVCSAAFIYAYYNTELL